MYQQAYDPNLTSIEPICRNCIFWDKENGVKLPNTNRHSQAFLPDVFYAPCGCATGCGDDGEFIRFMNGEASCPDHGDSFEPTAHALWEAREYRENRELPWDWEETDFFSQRRNPQSVAFGEAALDIPGNAPDEKTVCTGIADEAADMEKFSELGSELDIFGGRCLTVPLNRRTAPVFPQ